MTNLVGQGHDGVVLARLDVVVDEGYKCSVVSETLKFIIEKMRLL